jgi:hypothetical protein
MTQVASLLSGYGPAGAKRDWLAGTILGAGALAFVLYVILAI